MHHPVETKHAPSPFILMPLGNRQPGQYDASDPHRHDYFELLFFATGGGVHRVDFKEHPIEKNTVHFVYPGQVHQLKRSAGCKGTVLAFTETYYGLGATERTFLRNLPFFAAGNKHYFIKLSHQGSMRVQQLVAQIQEEYEQDSILRDKAIQSGLTLLLIELKRNWPEEGQSNAKENAANALVKKFRQLIDDFFNVRHAVNDYARQLHVTPNHLNDCCKIITGQNAGALIQERIILEARRLLFNTDLSAKEIAHQLGYEDPAYFSRFFKKSVQVSPNDFRNHSRKKYQ